MSIKSIRFPLGRFLLGIIGILVFAGGASAQALPWQLDANHSAAYFQVRHLNVTNVKGNFHKMTAAVTYDPADPGKTTIEATIDAASIDTDVEPRDKDLKSDNYFDVAKFPTLTFKSTRTAVAGAGKLKVTGNLTIHGVTKEVTFDVTGPTALVKDDKGNTFMGASGMLTLNRKDYGIVMNPAISDDVMIDVELAMVRRAPPAPVGTPSASAK